MYVPWFKPEPLNIPLPDVGIESLRDGIFVHPFGALVATGVLVGSHIASKRARSEGIDPKVLGEMAAYILIGGFVLGHMLDSVFYHWDVVQRDPLFVLQLWNGLSSFGGFIGAILGGVIWSLLRGFPLLPFADIASYAFPFGWVFGRMGCFVVHDHPGAVTDFPLAVENYEVMGHMPPWQVRHDLGLYEVFWSLAVIPLFLYLGRKKRVRGFYAALLPLLYAPVRFGLDFLRATDIPNGDPRILSGLTPGHYGALLFLTIGLGVAAYIFRGAPAPLPRAVRWSAEDDGRHDPRTAEQLLPLLGTPRGPVKVTRPLAALSMVARWPGHLLIIDLREAADWSADKWEKLSEELDGLGPTHHHLWRLSAPPTATLERVAELMAETPATERELVVLTEGDAADAAEALSAPVWLERQDDLWWIIERDDGGIVFDMRGEPDAQPGASDVG